MRHEDWTARGSGRPGLLKLYGRAKASQWDAGADIDWTPDVNFGEPLRPRLCPPHSPGFSGASRLLDVVASTEFRWELQAWMVSQFLYGEQGALLAAARLVETMPDLDAKYCAATQVVDEARHVEVYGRYLQDKLKVSYPISQDLASLLDNIIDERRWDVTCLGMQIIVEGLALAAFRFGAATFHDDVIRQIVDYVARDEARHLSFGILSLQGIYAEMTSRELAEREEFVMEAVQLMANRFLLEDVWVRLEVPVDDGKQFAASDPQMVAFRQMLFSKTLPSLGRLGLLNKRVITHVDQLGLLSAGNALMVRQSVGPGEVSPAWDSGRCS